MGSGCAGWRGPPGLDWLVVCRLACPICLCKDRTLPSGRADSGHELPRAVAETGTALREHRGCPEQQVCRTTGGLCGATVTCRPSSLIKAVWAALELPVWKQLLSPGNARSQPLGIQTSVWLSATRRLPRWLGSRASACWGGEFPCGQSGCAGPCRCQSDQLTAPFTCFSSSCTIFFTCRKSWFFSCLGPGAYPATLGFVPRSSLLTFYLPSPFSSFPPAPSSCPLFLLLPYMLLVPPGCVLIAPWPWP